MGPRQMGQSRFSVQIKLLWREKHSRKDPHEDSDPEKTQGGQEDDLQRCDLLGALLTMEPGNNPGGHKAPHEGRQSRLEDRSIDHVGDEAHEIEASQAFGTRDHYRLREPPFQ